MHAVEAETRSALFDHAKDLTTSATAPTHGARLFKRLT
jgi:hypothetical protein